MTILTQERWICDTQSTIKAFGGGQSSSTTNSDPWAGQQPYLTQVMSEAGNQYNNYTPQYYGAQGTSLNGQDISGQSTIAGFNPMESGAISAIGNTGLNGNSSFNAANTAMTNQLSGDPAMNQSIAAGVVPGLESQFAQGNAMNSPAAAYAVSNGLDNALLQNQQGAANTANTLYNSQLGGQQQALGAGQAQQAQDQNQLQNQVNMFNYQQQLPYTKLNQFSNLVNGQYGGTSTTTSPSQSLFGSIFSDRRLKEDIEPIGRDSTGLMLYVFRYKGSVNKMLGYMSDEVKKLYPHAVTVGPFDYDMVNYGAL